MFVIGGNGVGRLSRPRRSLGEGDRFECKSVIFERARNKCWLGCGDIPVVESEAGNMVAKLQECVPIGQAGDLRIQHQWLDLTFHAEVVARTQAGGVRLAKSLDL